MPKRSSTRKKDLNETAFNIVEQTIRLSEQDGPLPRKNPAAVTLGKLGGLKGGKARAKSLSKKRRAEIAAKAAEARWRKNNK